MTRQDTHRTQQTIRYERERLRSAEGEKRERRHRLQENVTSTFDIVLAVLAVALLALIILEFAADLQPPWDARVTSAQLGIWALFVIAFAIEFIIAPSKVQYLRSNWLVALSLAVPALRIFRVLRAVRILRGARAFRGFNLLRVTAALNRATQAIREFFRFSRFAYLIAITVIVALAGGVVGYYLERGQPDATIETLGDGLWWSVTTMLEIGSPLDAVTAEARVVAVVLRIYSLAIVGYLTATIAAFLLGKRDKRDDTTDLRELRKEIRELRETIERKE